MEISSQWQNLCLIWLHLQFVQSIINTTLKNAHSITCRWTEGELELCAICVLMTMNSKAPYDFSQRLHIGIKKHWGDGWFLRAPSVGVPRAGHSLPKLYHLELAFEEGLGSLKDEAQKTKLNSHPRISWSIVSKATERPVGLHSLRRSSCRATPALPIPRVWPESQLKWI